MAWIFSRWRGVFQGRSGPRIVRQSPTGWARAVSAAFNSIGTVRSGLQPQGGLSRVKNGRVATLTSRNGLPCDTVHWVMEDDDHSFWLYTGLRPGAHCPVRVGRVGRRSEADDPDYGFRQFRRSQEQFDR